MSAGPLFDAHLHYNAQDAAHFSPAQITNILDRNQIQQAVVTSTPPAQVTALYKHAPGKIVPLLGIYKSYQDKANWAHDTSLPARVEANLKQGHWRGIGELHLFAEDRNSPVFHRLIELAQQYKLPLMIHGDPAVIDTVYERAPKQPVVWAHAGTYPYPDLISNYLKRYPALMIDVSVRDQRISPGGQVHDNWYELFIRYPDRVMVGIDTFSTSRWENFDSAVKLLRSWLKQLPDDIAKKLAYKNAAVFFGKPAK